MKFKEILLNKYGYDNPIILVDLKVKGYSQTAIRQAMSRLEKTGEINRFSNGIYYFSNGEEIDTLKIIQRKYLTDGKSIYGYYNGTTFENMIFKKENKDILEIRTNKEFSRRRIVKYKDIDVVVRSSKLNINKNNYLILQFLEFMQNTDLKILTANKDKVVNYIIENNFKREDLTIYMKHFNGNTFKNVIMLDLIKFFN